MANLFFICALKTRTVETLYPIDNTGGIARGNPHLVKRPCPWIAV